MTDKQALSQVFMQVLQSLYPDSYVFVRPWRCLGTENILVTFAVETKEKWVNGIMENDPANCKFCLEEEKGKFVIGQPTMHFTNRFGEVGIRFRKITAPTAEEALQKLLYWFQKHQAAIQSLRKPL